MVRASTEDEGIQRSAPPRSDEGEATCQLSYRRGSQLPYRERQTRIDQRSDHLSVLQGAARRPVVRIIGNDDANSLTGSDKADVIDGGPGFNYRSGGGGNDWFVGRDGCGVALLALTGAVTENLWARSWLLWNASSDGQAFASHGEISRAIRTPTI